MMSRYSVCLPAPSDINLLATGLSTADVARELKCDVRSVLRMVKKGRLTKALVPIPGRKPKPVFSREEVDSLKTLTLTGELVVERDAKTIQAMSQEKNKAATAVARQVEMSGEAFSAIATVGEALAGTLEDIAARFFAREASNGAGKSVQVYHKILVTIPEAVALGFTATVLRSMLQCGQLVNLGSPHRIRLSRAKLEQVALEGM